MVAMSVVADVATIIVIMIRPNHIDIVCFGSKGPSQL